LCSALGLKATPSIFLHHYCTHLGKKVGWLSFASRSGNRLLDPFTSFYKNFKDGFFNILFEVEGRLYVYDSDVPKFSLYWTKSPTGYRVWPKSTMLEEELASISILDRLPKGLLDTFWCEDPSIGVLDMFFCLFRPLLLLLTDSLVVSCKHHHCHESWQQQNLQWFVKKKQLSVTEKGKKMIAESVPKATKPITIAVLSYFHPPLESLPPFAMESEVRHQKKKKHKSSHRLPKHLRLSTTAKETMAALDFISKRVIISNCIMVDLSDSERGHYSSSSAEDLINAFLELCSRTLLID